MSGLGTSLPELTVAMVAVRKSQGVAIGTLIGSNITDPLLSIGISTNLSNFTYRSVIRFDNVSDNSSNYHRRIGLFRDDVVRV